MLWDGFVQFKRQARPRDAHWIRTLMKSERPPGLCVLREGVVNLWLSPSGSGSVGNHGFLARMRLTRSSNLLASSILPVFI